MDNLIAPKVYPVFLCINNIFAKRVVAKKENEFRESVKGILH